VNNVFEILWKEAVIAEGSEESNTENLSQDSLLRIGGGGACSGYKMGSCLISK